MNININSKEQSEVKEHSLPTAKKEKIKGKFKLTKLILPVLIIALCVGGYFAYRTLGFANSVGVKIKAGDIINNLTQKPELRKDSTGKYTTALIVGIDTRGKKANSSLLNTDSMIIATYNYKTKDITMVSLPRDIWVNVPGYSFKVNGIYAHGETMKKGNGMQYLADNLTKITGIEIQYYAMVDLEGFKKMINAVGGVTVNVENTFTDTRYPTEDPHKPAYETITFKKGIQAMDATTALKFARSRHSFDPLEGTDWARAKRQQKVIGALKDKMLTTETLFNPQKVMEILSAIQDNVQLFGLNLKDIQAGINLAQEYKKDPGGTYNFVLQPSYGHYKVITSCPRTVTTLSAQCPVLGIANFTGIKDLVKLSISHPAIYSSDPIIRIYDSGMGYAAAKKQADAIANRYRYINVAFMGTKYSGKEGIYVYSSGKKFSGSVKDLASYLATTNTTKPDFAKTNSGEDVTILLGKAVTTSTTK